MNRGWGRDCGRGVRLGIGDGDGQDMWAFFAEREAHDALMRMGRGKGGWRIRGLKIQWVAVGWGGGRLHGCGKTDCGYLDGCVSVWRDLVVDA